MTVLENVAFGLRVRRARAAVGARSRGGSRELLDAGAARRARRRAIPPSSPAASASAWRWPARSRSSRECCCWTSRSARSTPGARELRRWLRELHDRIGVTTRLRDPRPGGGARARRPRGGDDRGRMVQIDRPAALLAEPATPFVAGFVGHATRVQGEVRDGVLGFGALPLPPLQVALPDGAACAFLRPRDVVAMPPGCGVAEPARRRSRRGDPPATCNGGGRVAPGGGGGRHRAGGRPAARGTPDWPVRGGPCRLRLCAAQVFGADGTRAEARPATAELALPCSIQPGRSSTFLLRMFRWISLLPP